ncbi:TRAP transporter small permease [Selenomonas sp. TAMA-11512]|uniref:TRAP transporter small permease n=1 Tax=Selenomonas sp. TAMA-11512 TaxID=3095337 RepID=UPI00308B52D4|nr:TRAP transporter small permease [Selenomonas sp. TAMA-11512]
MDKIIRIFAGGVEKISVVCMVLMVAVVFLATCGRYTMLFSIPWSEEFARYCMVAIVYLGLMLASLQEKHFVVELVPLIFKSSPKVIRGFRILTAVLLDAFAIFLANYGYVVVEKMLSQGKLSPMLKLPLGIVYALIPIGILLMAIFYTYRVLRHIPEKGEET